MRLATWALGLAAFAAALTATRGEAQTEKAGPKIG